MSGGASDLAERRRALDPARSFIVQAPAGSGKTELLIQRFLVLLAQVDAPEEIAAITFTRKAAAEMRSRVLAALAAAQQHDPSRAAGEPHRQGGEPHRQGEEPHRVLTLKLARAALERDRQRGWKLEEHASRLRVQTFDALCASLTRQMPLLSALGAQPAIVEDAMPFYREAALATLAMLEERGRAGELVARLLAHLDGEVALAQEMIAAMLARRDQWLREALGAIDQAALESALAAEVRLQVERARALIPRGAGIALAADAGRDECRALADALLTKDGKWRVRSREAQALAGNEPLRQALLRLRALPPQRYLPGQWEALEAITGLLPLAVAQLRLLFAARGQADFAEIAQRALAALGTPEAPTDLLLALDYRVHHILVDEFQDTSITQLLLLERLTGGWQPEDRRTLFLVGDPMQSIYRFRQAEVGIFLRVRQAGLPGVPLAPLALSANFRSQPAIVDWTNRAFARVMPAEEDVGTGAVPHARSEAALAAGTQTVGVHAFFDDDREGEARRVVALVDEARREIPGGSIAILVRARSHLAAIVPALGRAGLRIRAIDIEPLGHRQSVQDLLALARALSHPADRLAWLAVLRAPWCGLSLADLHALAAVDGSEHAAARRAVPAREPRQPGGDLFPQTLPTAGEDLQSASVWELLHDEDRLARLGADGRARATHARALLAPLMAERSRGTLRSRVEAAWLALGGPACLADDTDLEDAEIFLDCLESSEQAGEIPDWPAFEEAVGDLHALPDVHAAADDPQVLTIHRAKGLEFDTVIVPGLGRAPPRRDPDLFLWLERPADPASLLIAPVRQAGGPDDPIYDYVMRLDREKGDHENGRLLYVAATRARARLHLLGDVRLDHEDGKRIAKPPARGSLLAKLWPAVEDEFAGQAAQYRESGGEPGSAFSGPGADAGTRSLPDQDLRRLAADWVPPLSAATAAAAVSWRAPPEFSRANDEVEFSWAGETARHVGSVVHRWLQRIAENALEGWSRERVEGLRAAFRNELAARGVGEGEMDAALGHVVAALANSLADERGRWLLGPQQRSQIEYRLSALIDGEVQGLVVDRTFVDGSGVRWIVDYKTSRHEGADREAFLDRERERYRAQLERYARALGGQAGAARTMLGLYFPLLGGWREWEAPR